MKYKELFEIQRCLNDGKLKKYANLVDCTYIYSKNDHISVMGGGSQ
jgi:hypothetical protein